VLIVEDDPGWALLVEEILSEATVMTFEAESVAWLSEAREELLKGSVDCVLLDLSLPDAGGLEGLLEIEKIAPEVPVVILSGLEDEALAIRSVQMGAQDYLLKANAEPGVLARAVRYAIERKRSEADLAYRALHDPLTGLPNRTLFLDRLDLALSRSRRRGSRVAVLFLDLDGFKNVNDTLGHPTGDRLLVEVAARLEALVRPTDTLARLGGDEFMLLCEDISVVDQAVGVAERVRVGMRSPFVVDGERIPVGVSIGIVFARGDAGATAEELIRDADEMMYRAKRGSTDYQLLDNACPPDSHEG
jgi:diguanylate cyclase (GGDEF)-like protein